MDAEAILGFYGGPGSEGYDARSESIDRALEGIETAFDVQTRHHSLTSHRVGEYGRGVELTGSEGGVLEATRYLIEETREHGLPVNAAFDPLHPIAAWKGYRLSSYVLAKEKGLEGHLDVDFHCRDPLVTMPMLESYAKSLSERYDVDATVRELVETHAVMIAIPYTETVGFSFHLDGDVNGIEGALRDMHDRFAVPPRYGDSDIFHPFKSFRGKNVAKVVELDDRE